MGRYLIISERVSAFHVESMVSVAKLCSKHITAFMSPFVTCLNKPAAYPTRFSLS